MGRLEVWKGQIWGRAETDWGTAECGSVSGLRLQDSRKEPKLMIISSKYCARVALGLAAMATSAGMVHGAIAFTNNSARGLAVGYAIPACAFMFRVNSDIVVTSLGYINDADATNSTVQLMDASGASLASTHIDASGTVASGFRFQPISPVTLMAGTTNYVIAANDTNGFWLGSTYYDLNGADIRVGSSPEVTWLGSLNWADRGNPSKLYRTFFFAGPNFGLEPVSVTPGDRPTLSVWLSSHTTVSLAWPTNFPSAVLQATADLVGATMTNVTAVPVVIGTNKVLELPREAAMAFFRLAN